MPDHPLDRIVQETFELSRLIRHHMVSEMKNREKSGGEGDGANLLQVHALIAIETHPGMTMKELAAVLLVTSPSATSFVARLVKLGWVERKQDPANRRIVRLHLTAKGRSILREKMQWRRREMRKMLSLLSSKDQEDLARILQRLHQRLLPVLQS